LPQAKDRGLFRQFPDTVSEAIAEIDRIGVGGLILVFRIGPMPAEVANNSIRLFMEKVAPRFRRETVAQTT